MKKLRIRFFALILAAFLALAAGAAQAAIPAGERTALLDLYTGANGASWKTSTGWNGAAESECGWYGVTCDAGGNTVTGINLNANNLSGALPATLNNLTNLQNFIVNSNKLSGSIPALAGLTALVQFYAPGNQFTGSIPALTGLAKLQTFEVGYNQLSGSIPDLTGLANLQAFDVDNNQLTGTIPPLAGLANLQSFSVAGNQLTGSIPDLTGLANLQAFVVDNNQLTGTIPPLTGLANLQSFSVAGNQLTGSIPALTGLTNLQYFDVDSNQLTGSIPALTGLTRLYVFSANYNQLSGPIPALTGLTNLGYFYAYFNHLTGTIPPLTGLANLQDFEAHGNQLTGTIPPLTGLTNLQYFIVQDNQLTGPIPTLTGLTNLVEFEAPSNQLTGTIPVFTGLTNLSDFGVGSNQLTGSIPDLNGLTNLVGFSAYTNQLTGSIPALTGLTNLRYFVVWGNQLTGSIPMLTGLTALVDFYAYSNQLTGSIPALTGLTNLQSLYVQNNQLTGNAPSVPSPDALVAGGSNLCPNYLNQTADPAWDAATGQTPWYTNCSAANMTFSVTYNSNGNGIGNTSGSVPIDGNAYAAGATVTVLGNTGNLARNINAVIFNFAGWNTAANSSGKSYEGGDTFVINSNVTLYAQWISAPTYSVTYIGNGNTGGSVPTGSNMYPAGATVNVLGNNGNLVKTGSIFAGWNTAANGGGTPYARGATFSIGAADVTLYAQWTSAQIYSVTYNGNGNTGGSAPTDGNAYAAGATVTVLGNSGNLIKTGCNLAGWNTAANGGGTPYAGGATFSIGAADVTLYAQWLTPNIDPNNNGASYAYGENVGWINLAPSQGPGVAVTGSGVSGFAWGENVGWINFSPADGGVVNDGAGHLSGHAWGENTGWINFMPQGGGVTIDGAGIFSGYAWGENIGWINFSDANSSVKTAWTPPPNTYTVTLNAGPNGSISGPATVNSGEKPTYAITPDSGYYVVDVTVGGVSVGAVTSYTFPTGIYAPVTIAATFTAMLPVRIAGTPDNYFQSLSLAYQSAIPGSSITIDAQGTSFTGDLNLSGAINIIILGGYDNTFTTQSGMTTLKGALTVGKGTLVADRLIID